MRRRLRSPAGRLLLVVATIAFAFTVVAGIATAAPGDGITATGATVDKFGWWNSKNQNVSTPGPNVTTPPPPGVPAGTLAVGAVTGGEDRRAAIGILPDAKPGDTIRAFTLTIKEAGQPAAQVNSAGAKIQACPITQFWVGAENGVWDGRPKEDCELASVEGVRAADGTWTFDLLPIGRAWLDPKGTLAADGIVLMEAVDPPQGFQSVFATSGEGAIVVTFDYESATGGTVDTTPRGFDDVDTGSGDLGGGSDFDSDFGGSGGVSLGPSAPTPSPTVTEAPQGQPPTAPRVIANKSPKLLGNFPGGLVLAVPMFIVLLGLLSYSLGPAGEPVAATRQRGVSRALAARARLHASAQPTNFTETL